MMIQIVTGFYFLKAKFFVLLLVVLERGLRERLSMTFLPLPNTQIQTFDAVSFNVMMHHVNLLCHEIAAVMEDKIFRHQHLNRLVLIILGAQLIKIS